MKKAKSTKKKLKVSEVGKLKERLARALADYDNLQKRIEKEKEQFEIITNLRFIKKLLPTLDMLEEVQGYVKDSGLAIALDSFNKILSEERVVRVKVKRGDKFDEDKHEAVEVVEEKGLKKGEIAGVELTGWEVVDGPVIRYAKVKVAKAS